jgi:small subunit ribosomal protein S8
MRSFYNLVAHIRNAGAVQNTFTCVPLSTFNIKALEIFYREGFISGYSMLDSRQAKVFISYLPNGVAIAGSLKVISRPSKRVYVSWKKLVSYYSGTFCLISTSQGLMTGTEAIRLQVGGELVCVRFYF